jgi:hypothetical protein
MNHFHKLDHPLTRSKEIPLDLMFFLDGNLALLVNLY